MIQEKRISIFLVASTNLWIAELSFQLSSIFIPLKNLKSIRDVIRKAPNEAT